MYHERHGFLRSFLCQSFSSMGRDKSVSIFFMSHRVAKDFSACSSMFSAVRRLFSWISIGKSSRRDGARRISVSYARVKYGESPVICSTIACVNATYPSQRILSPINWMSRIHEISATSILWPALII